jgi:hypothetical protein
VEKEFVSCHTPLMFYSVQHTVQALFSRNSETYRLKITTEVYIGYKGHFSQRTDFET